MSSRNNKRNQSQGILDFGETLIIPDRYDLERARKAAKRRNQRIGKVALERTRGFRRRTDNLFVPHSGTENSSIVKMPEAKVTEDKLSASDRVIKKYEESDLPTKKVNLWAAFAKYNAEKNTRYNYRKFMNESLSNAMRIAFALNPDDREIVREAFEYDPDYRIDPEAHTLKNGVLAYNSVLKYTMDLEAFGGTNPELFRSNGTRVWPIPSHKHKYREKMDKAHEELNVLADDVFAERVDEAYWSHYSRSIFWLNVDKQHREFVRQRNIDINSPPEPIPIEAYEKDPENFI